MKLVLIIFLLISCAEDTKIKLIQKSLISLDTGIQNEQKKIDIIKHKEPEKLFPKIKALSQLRISRFDSIVEPIIRQKGYPVMELDSVSNSIIGNLIISIANDSIIELHLKGLQEASELGFISMRRFMSAIDQMELQKSNQQIYGTVFRMDHHDNSKMILVPVKNIAYADSIRKNNGIESIREYCEKYGVNYPETN